MEKFSERIGVSDSSQVIQIEGIDDNLKNSLWNFVHAQYEYEYKEFWKAVAKYIARDFRKVPINELPLYNYECKLWVKTYFYSLEWNKVYELIEFLVEGHQKKIIYSQINLENIIQFYNKLLERELSGYRFISGVLAPITNTTEMSEISEAIQNSQSVGFIGAHQHIKAAIKLFGEKPEPDYRNVIKEAISAVESVAKLITGDDSSGLSGALAILENKIEMHKALKAGFVKLYGYTSNEDGIRHAILEESEVGFDEAKYMIVACSAFVNFLISKANTSQLIK